MINFKKSGGFGGGKFEKRSFGPRPSFGARPSFGGAGARSDAPRPMYPATCDSCGSSCEVPFRPNGEKPVYCRNCFVDKNPAPAGNFGAYGARNDFGHKARAERAPVRESAGSDTLAKEVAALSSKVDRILAMLEASKKPETTLSQAVAGVAHMNKEAAPVSAKKPAKSLATSAKKVAAPKEEKAPAKKVAKKAVKEAPAKKAAKTSKKK